MSRQWCLYLKCGCVWILQCCGSGIQCLLEPWIRDRFFLDSRSGSRIRIRIPYSDLDSDVSISSYSWRSYSQRWYSRSSISQRSNSRMSHSRRSYSRSSFFVWRKEKKKKTNNFTSSFLVGSENGDGEKSGSGISIPDAQHCLLYWFVDFYLHIMANFLHSHCWIKGKAACLAHFMPSPHYDDLKVSYS